MSGLRKSEPVRSVLESDPDAREALDRFVVALGEHLDELQDAEQARDLERVTRAARELRGAAERCGYPALVALSVQVIDACADRDGPAVRKHLEALTELVPRVRLGHRGAA